MALRPKSNGIAANDPLAVRRLLGSNPKVEPLSNVGRENEQRSAWNETHHNTAQRHIYGRRLTGVNDSARVFEPAPNIVHGDHVQFDLPVSLSTHRDICELAFVGRAVDTTKGNLSVFLEAPKTESEDRPVKEAPVPEVVEWRDDCPDSSGIISEAQNTIVSARILNVEWRCTSGQKELLT